MGIMVARKSLVGMAALGAALIAPSVAAADAVGGLRSDRLWERSHKVSLRFDRGNAKLVVRRTVFNAGPRHDQATFFIDVPRGSVATGLKTLGSQHGRPKWFTGDLMEAEAAARKYRELTGIGGYYPKDPALLSWRSQSLLALQVFPCPPGEAKSIEYTLELPATYRDGAYHVSLPAMGTEDLLATLTVKSKNRRDRVLVDGKRVARGGRVALDRSAPIDIALVPHRLPRLSGRLSAIPFAKDRVLTRLEVAAAARISKAPRNAHVVVVLDESRSFEDSTRAARAAASAYLSHMKGAKVRVLGFDRSVREWQQRFVSVAQARADLQGHPVRLGNGSHVELAVAEAERLLAKAPRGSARRIVVVTDARTRNALTRERLGGAVGASKAVVHFGVMNDGKPSLSRNDVHPWSKVARSTGGLVWRASASTDATDARAQSAVYEEWARPLRLDHVAIYSSDLPISGLPQAADVPTTLDEGQGHEDLFIADRGAKWFRVEGELWSKRVSHTVARSTGRDRLWSALVFGSNVLGDLSEKEMMKLAMAGGAVSPVTSYLAIEPGVRPSTEGIDWGSGSGFGFGARAPRVRMGATRVGPPPFNKQRFLEQALAPEWRRCGGKPGEASVTLETTLAEVVDVPSAYLEGMPDDILKQCLINAAWALSLPVQFDGEWNSFTVDV